MSVGKTGSGSLAERPSLILIRNVRSYPSKGNSFFVYSKFFIASSICEFSNESRYICVVARSECPSDSEMIAMFTPERFSTVAYVCRATCKKSRKAKVTGDVRIIGKMFIVSIFAVL